MLFCYFTTAQWLVILLHVLLVIIPLEKGIITSLEQIRFLFQPKDTLKLIVSCLLQIGSLVLEKWKMWQRLQTDGLTDGHTKSGQKIKNAIKRSLNNVLFCPTWYTCICIMFLIRVNGAINMTKNKQLVLSD